MSELRLIRARGTTGGKTNTERHERRRREPQVWRMTPLKPRRPTPDERHVCSVFRAGLAGDRKVAGSIPVPPFASSVEVSLSETPSP